MPGLAQQGWLRLVAAVLFAGILGLLFAVSDPKQATAVLFVVPIALLALSDGLCGGLAGAVAGACLTALWVIADDIDIGALGWGSRLVAFVVIGALVGLYEDFARRHVTRRLDERYAAELQDRVVQSLVLATYDLRDGRDPAGHVDRALAEAKALISERLGEVEPGDLRLSAAP